MKKIIIILVAMFIITVVAGLLSIPGNGQQVIVEIKQGAGAAGIADMLRDKGVIRNRKAFLVLLKVLGVDRKIKKGTYRIEAGIGVSSLIRKLTKGEVMLARLTVPEGFTVKQVAALVEEKGLGDSEKFLELADPGLEGYLFPETYFIPRDSTEEDIIKMMTAQFDRTFTGDIMEAAGKYRFTRNDVVILASIIEKEAVRESERNLISAVFHNRLKKRYYLESCATVQYALGSHRKKLLYEDLQVDSPYNTYRNFGLPPGPICNPGRNSLLAAVNPVNTDVMFFVSNGDGSHKFSRYYSKHLEIQRK